MKTKTIYKCGSCHAESSKWSAKCLECGSFGTIEEVLVAKKPGKALGKGENPSSAYAAAVIPLERLKDVKANNSDRIVTSLSEFNRVMGGGIVKDSVSIITAKPGAGKSTLLLQVANDLAEKGYKILYATGEESDSQIKNRADRILKSISENIWVIPDTSMNNVLGHIEQVNPDLIIIDSIQTFALEEHFPSRAGSPTQTMECANAMVRIAKNPKRPRAVIFVGQMNKNEEMAGLRSLEHLVDAVLVIEGENEDELRELQTTKNRFGGTGEMGFFSMGEEGLISIDNPSEYFMTIRNTEDKVSGSALTVVREGTRPIILEIESLVSTSFMPYPTRIGEGLKRDHLNILISILEQRGKFNLLNKNVVIKTTGGLKVKENAINLSILMSIVSSFAEKPIPNNYVFIADVGLTGELKKVPSTEQRIRELDRMGFEKVYIAPGTFSRKVKFENIQVIEKKTLPEVIHHVFGPIERFSK